MAPMRTDRGGSPPRGARASLPLPRRLIRQIARHVASSGRSLRRLEVSGRVIENFDDIENITDEEEQMDTAVAAMACGGTSGNLPPQQLDDDLTSLSWLQDRNLLRGINLTTKSDEVQENKLNGHSVIVKQEPESPPPAPVVHNKPPYSFSCLIFMAIEAAPTRALPVKEIYAWITKHFPYFKTAPQGWKNSVRHNLSLNKCFHKVAAAPGLGKGSLWTVDPQHRTTLLQLTTNAGCVIVRPNPESSNENSPVKAESVIEKVETARAMSGTMTGAISGAMSGADRGSENGVTEPGTDEYIAAATVLAMKYGPRFLEQLPPEAHLVISRCNGDDHSYSGCEERRTAEALLNLAGITADSHTLVPS